MDVDLAASHRGLLSAPAPPNHPPHSLPPLQYRPGYPPHVLQAIYEFAALPQRQLALDVACGTGQMAVSLADAFQRVVAQDSSASQLQHAQRRPNIAYEQAAAETTGLPPASVDLVTAAQCLHWCARWQQGWVAFTRSRAPCCRCLQLLPPPR